MEDFIIATDPDFTVSDYQDALEMGNKQDKDYIVDAMERRFLNRYIVPGEAEGYKNGFNIMANCCLLIETLESFYRGWSKSPNSSLAFCNFFNRVPEFSEFTGNDMPNEFYKHIRCGILHQGETTGGWRIRRDQKVKLKLEEKIIDANHFRDGMRKVVENYSEELKQNEWDSELWKMLKKKMKALIKNCNA